MATAEGAPAGPSLTAAPVVGALTDLPVCLVGGFGGATSFMVSIWHSDSWPPEVDPTSTGSVCVPPGPMPQRRVTP
jgi:hypothetical protein